MIEQALTGLDINYKIVAVLTFMTQKTGWRMWRRLSADLI